MKITQVRSEVAGGHALVSVWVDGKQVGRLAVAENEGIELAKLLLPDAPDVDEALNVVGQYARSVRL